MFCSPWRWILWGVAACLLATALAVRPAKAGTGYIQLQCWKHTDDDVDVPINWATLPWEEATADSTDTARVQSYGSLFKYTGLSGDIDYDIQCSFRVPGDYNTGGSTPQVTLMGWSIDDVGCTGIGCYVDYRVRFDVAWRDFDAGDLVVATGWSGTTNNGTMAYTSESCPGGGSCFRSDRVKEATINAATNASSWAVGNLVFLRIRRNNTFSAAYNNLQASFHLANVLLSYPN